MNGSKPNHTKLVAGIAAAALLVGALIRAVIEVARISDAEDQLALRLALGAVVTLAGTFATIALIAYLVERVPRRQSSLLALAFPDTLSCLARKDGASVKTIRAFSVGAANRMKGLYFGATFDDAGMHLWDAHNPPERIFSVASESIVHIAEKTYAIGHVAVSALEFTIREKDGDHPLVITPVAQRRLSHQDLKPEARRELMRALNALWGLASSPGNWQKSVARHTLELISATRRIHYM